MEFLRLLERLRRIWHWSAGVSIACLLVPVFVPFFQPSRAFIIMHRVGDHPVNPLKLINWEIHVGAYCSVVSAVIAIAAGVTYLVGTKYLWLPVRIWDAGGTDPSTSSG
jgi:hypothetical protein